MNRRTITTLAAVMLAATMAHAALPLETLDGLTWTRGATNTTISGTYLCGSTIMLTNCTANYTSTNVVQDLTGLGGYVTVGNSVTGKTAAISIVNASSGTFWVASITIPTALQLVPTNITYTTTMEFYDSPVPSKVVTWQLTLTNSAGQAYIYRDDKTMTTRAPMP